VDVIEQRIATLEDEVKRLRGKLRKLDTDEQLNLSSPLIARTLDGNEIPILRGYTGYQYEPNTYNTITLYGAPYVYMDTDGTYLLIGATATAGFTFPPNAYIKPRTVGSYGTVEIGAYDNGAGGDFTLFSAYSIDVRKNLGLGTSADDTSLGGTPVDGWIFYRTDTDRLRLRANGAWVDLIDSGNASWTDLTDGGDTTLHSHALTSAYTQVYHKDNNGTSGRGPAATTSEVSLGSFTVTGGDMGTTGILRVRLIGHFVASGATSTVRIRVKFGGSTVYDDTSVTTAVNLPWFAEIHVANVGSASSQRIGGLIIIGANGATTGYGNLGTDEVNATTPIYATSSVNTASNQTFEVTAQLSNGTSPNAFTCYSLVAELL